MYIYIYSIKELNDQKNRLIYISKESLCETSWFIYIYITGGHLLVNWLDHANWWLLDGKLMMNWMMMVHLMVYQLMITNWFTSYIVDSITSTVHQLLFIRWLMVNWWLCHLCQLMGLNLWLFFQYWEKNNIFITHHYHAVIIYDLGWSNKTDLVNWQTYHTKVVLVCNNYDIMGAKSLRIWNHKEQTMLSRCLWKANCYP